MPAIERLIQGTPEWLAFRRQHVMATDASIICGTNPFCSIRELMEEKLELRPTKEMNDAMRRGQELEHEARDIFIKNIGIIFKPCVYQSDKYPWMAASLDGLSECGKYILEIKCPGHKSHDDAIEGKIKDYYLTQMDHQALCVGIETVYYVSYRPEHDISYFCTIYEPSKINQKHMIKLEEEFYNQLCTMQLPPEPWKFCEK